ncbi:hypothetical protein G8770_20940 [Aestuariicella hydrocarbonica]|uniref:Uncharacterized protein n=1 Tax=Pseudomaricurvus hydrocarbonicus TaxID=1470433 RepID=A0A9E5MPF7_9GAMM|nr:hypothetical protein [Aestuariicella hydrocarbonica]NHO68021.1 hypothetical protein [Aestuariicella hydrocarbonica]
MNATKITLLAITLFAALGYVWFTSEPQLQDSRQIALPWNVEPHEDGTSTVFDIRLETTTVSELLTTLGEDHEIAIISDAQDRSGLEIYYSYFSSGPIRGKLIAQVAVHDDTLSEMKTRAASSSYMDSGARKFLLSPADYDRIQSMPINNLALTPSANLDEQIILSRFGLNAQRVLTPEGIEHFLYPQLGIDIALSQEAKELIQYVAPRSFKVLSAPLETLAEQESLESTAQP